VSARRENLALAVTELEEGHRHVATAALALSHELGERHNLARRVHRAVADLAVLRAVTGQLAEGRLP
jgi:hypothetical protein